ncbi:MAG: hypothetical protein MO847_07850 [Candidatus Protistobacter heckmanni]|nr:hypothetical protein [Candidatus Protistobacter heckmanni]
MLPDGRLSVRREDGVRFAAGADGVARIAGVSADWRAGQGESLDRNLSMLALGRPAIHFISLDPPAAAGAANSASVVNAASASDATSHGASDAASVANTAGTAAARPGTMHEIFDPAVGRRYRLGGGAAPDYLGAAPQGEVFYVYNGTQLLTQYAGSGTRMPLGAFALARRAGGHVWLAPTGEHCQPPALAGAGSLTLLPAGSRLKLLVDAPAWRGYNRLWVDCRELDGPLDLSLKLAAPALARGNTSLWREGEDLVLQDEWEEGAQIRPQGILAANAGRIDLSVEAGRNTLNLRQAALTGLAKNFAMRLGD